MLSLSPQVKLLIVHEAAELHDWVIGPLSPLTETKTWSPPLKASQEIIMSFDEQLIAALTFWGGQGAAREDNMLSCAAVH